LSIGLSALPQSIVQLYLGEPTLLSDPNMAAILDSTIDSSATPMQPSVVLHGLTPMVVDLLSSSSAVRRTWARAQLPALARQPLSFDEWCNLGIGVQLQAMYSGGGGLGGQEKWEVLSTIVAKGLLNQDTVARGILDGRNSVEEGARNGKSLMAVLAPSLGTPDDGESGFPLA
jgi:senataxin